MAYECVILYRNTSNGKVGFIYHDDDEDNLAVYDNVDAALAATNNVPMLRVYPYQIVELDEL